VLCCAAHELLELVLVFFFQAEDGIRDKLVTGVQTCALPIFQPDGPSASGRPSLPHADGVAADRAHPRQGRRVDRAPDRDRRALRSEERRVGKEWRTRWSRDSEKKKKG